MKLPTFPGRLTMQWVERTFLNSDGRESIKKVRTYNMSNDQQDWLRRCYPETENGVLLEKMGNCISLGTLHRMAKELGLKKSEAGMRRIRKRHAAQVKRICEKNGYYASLRGKRPSDQCMHAMAKMWQEVKEGKREHPAQVMKRENPRRYRKWMERKSIERKASIQRETRRMLYGLERQTKLKCVVLTKYTKSQTSHRYNALRRGYFVMQDCSEQSGERYNIYYDDTTERSSRFEKNLVDDGFNLVQWTDD